MLAKQLRSFLDAHQVKYVVIQHSPAFTAQEVAASAHVSGRELAKTVVVRLDDELVLAVVPATRQVDLESLCRAAGAGRAELPSESDFRGRFPDCQPGAMPPFGNLYQMPVYADPSLAGEREIAFNAGTHTDLVRLSFEDFRRLATPRLVEIAGG
jgi:Ala-tRNA(Pro) deacylase